MGTGSYAQGVSAIHRTYAAALKRAKTRQSVLRAFWKHKKDHERLLKKHLGEEMTDVNRIKGKMKLR